MAQSQLSLQAQAAFQPNAAQRRLLEYIFQKPSFLTIQELCDGAGVPRRTYYYWCQNPAFRLWLATSWSALMLVDGITLINVARLNCTRQYGYWKALFDLTFNPKGLGFLQQWQQALAQADDSAFALEDPPPADESGAGARPQPAAAQAQAPAPCATAAADNSSKINGPSPADCSNRLPPGSASAPQVPQPHHVAKHLQKSLGRPPGH